MKIPILKKDDDWSMHWDKLKEECEELLTEISDRKAGSKNDGKILEETFDVIQMAVGILDKLEGEGCNIEKASYSHIGKLVDRCWRFKEILEISKM